MDKYPPTDPEREIERRKIMTRLFAAEFGSSILLDPPSTPPDQWEEVLGESIEPAILAKARELADKPKGYKLPREERLFKPLF